MIFPRTQVPRCRVQNGRQSLRDVGWRERRAVARDLQASSGAPTSTEAEAAVDRVPLTWDSHDPPSSLSWRRDGTRLTVFVDDPPALRTVLGTTTAIASLNDA